MSSLAKFTYYFYVLVKSSGFCMNLIVSSLVYYLLMLISLANVTDYYILAPLSPCDFNF